MQAALQLYGSLIIALLGIVTPIIIILLSLHSKGSSKLIEQYENEKNQSETNITNLASNKGNIDKIEQSIKELKASKKEAAAKLNYLNPKLQIAQLFTSFTCALIFIILSYSFNYSSYILILIYISLSLIFFYYGLFILWNLLCILIEVRKFLDDEENLLETKKNEINMKIIDLLSEISQKPNMDYLKVVSIKFNNKKILDNSNTYEMVSNTKQSITVFGVNSEVIMAKKVVIGFIFPLDFIIEKKDQYSIYTTEKEQIVRYKIDSISANTSQSFSDLLITPLKQGTYKITTFISAENIKEISRYLTIIVK